VEALSLHLKKGRISGFLKPIMAGKYIQTSFETIFLPAMIGCNQLKSLYAILVPFGEEKRIGYLPDIPPFYAYMTIYSFLNFIINIFKNNASGRKNRNKMNGKARNYHAGKIFLYHTGIKFSFLPKPIYR